ncbi:MAG: hypothetical protein ACRD6X_21590 [Pyrinomonadaceae bacterium]
MPNGATWPARVHRLPLTTFVVIPAVDGGKLAGGVSGSVIGSAMELGVTWKV